ncbi:MAG: Nif3-like dinuclear metal center hexameric protein [Lachnospiraceae bacterium]
MEALDRGLSIIDAGHYGLEHIFMEDMNRFLKEKASKLVVTTETIQHPFRIL